LANVPNAHRFAHQAMATTFEAIIQYEDRSYAQQAARAAFDEVDRLEGYLSRFLETSDVTRINHLLALQPVQLSLDTFECLKISADIHAETAGAFDSPSVSRGLLAGQRKKMRRRRRRSCSPPHPAWT
jgi:thiamine biosynthesis lipoprotein